MNYDIEQAFKTLNEKLDMLLDRQEFLGWWCQRGPGYVFHTDPVEGCPGPHVGCWGSAPTPEGER